MREGQRNFREDIKLFIGLPKQPLLELSPPVELQTGQTIMLSLHCFVHDLNATKLKFYSEDDYVELYRLSKCLSLLRTVLNSSPGGGTPIHYIYGYVPPKGVVILKLLI